MSNLPNFLEILYKWAISKPYNDNNNKYLTVTKKWHTCLAPCDNNDIRKSTNEQFLNPSIVGIVRFRPNDIPAEHDDDERVSEDRDHDEDRHDDAVDGLYHVQGPEPVAGVEPVAGAAHVAQVAT